MTKQKNTDSTGFILKYLLSVSITSILSLLKSLSVKGWHNAFTLMQSLYLLTVQCLSVCAFLISMPLELHFRHKCKWIVLSRAALWVLIYGLILSVCTLSHHLCSWTVPVLLAFYRTWCFAVTWRVLLSGSPLAYLLNVPSMDIISVSPSCSWAKHSERYQVDIWHWEIWAVNMMWWTRGL